MRFDAETYPSLFHKGLLIPVNIPKDRKDDLDEVIAIAQNNLFYITQPVIEASTRSFRKLVPFVKDLPDVIRGLAFKWNGRPSTMLYTLLLNKGEVYIMGQIHMLDPEGKQYGCVIAGSFPLHEFTKDAMTFRLLNWCPADPEVAGEMAKAVLVSEVFLNFAELETKEIKPSEKIWSGPNICAYNNKSKRNVTIVDSSWYTNLVVSGAFDVRGHFRLQPFGPEMKQRRLIWIKDFKKSGYTRKAKKQTEDDKGRIY